MKNLFDNNGAEFSTNKAYRFCLWRIWDEKLPKIMFVGLNPSTANETNNDATIRRVISFAKQWGYGGVYMLNCFALVSTNPKMLEDYFLPMIDQDKNDEWIIKTSKKSNEIVFAWGNFKIVKETGRDLELLKMFPKAKCLGINKNGSPKHPLYIPNNTNLIPYKKY